MKRNKVVNSYNQINRDLEKKIDKMMSIEIPDDESTNSVESDDLKIIDDKKENIINNLNANLNEKILVLDNNQLDNDNHDFSRDVKVNILKDSIDKPEIVKTNNIVNGDDLEIDDQTIEEIEKNEADDLLVLEDMLEDELNQNTLSSSHHKKTWFVLISLMIVLVIITVIFVLTK